MLFRSDSIQLFDALPREAALNFHIYFLLRLARFFGIEPDWSEPGTLFDLREGHFRLSAPLHSQFLDEASTAALHALSRINTRNLRLFRFTRQQRRDIINHLLLYYTLHHRPVLSLPSMAVITEM